MPKENGSYLDVLTGGQISEYNGLLNARRSFTSEFDGLLVKDDERAEILKYFIENNTKRLRRLNKDFRDEYSEIVSTFDSLRNR